MSLDIGASFGIGWFIGDIGELNKFFEGLREVVPAKFQQENRWDPCTGEPSEPESVEISPKMHKYVVPTCGAYEFEAYEGLAEMTEMSEMATTVFDKLGGCLMTQGDYRGGDFIYGLVIPSGDATMQGLREQINNINELAIDIKAVFGFDPCKRYGEPKALAFWQAG